MEKMKQVGGGECGWELAISIQPRLPVQYGTKYYTALKMLFWEDVSRHKNAYDAILGGKKTGHKCIYTDSQLHKENQ